MRRSLGVETANLESSKDGIEGKSLKIVEVEVLGRGGLAHYVNNLSRALSDRGHRVTLITAWDYELQGRTSRSESLRIERITARRTGQSPRSRPGPWFRLLRRLEAIRDAFAVARRVRHLRPDVIHLHSTNPIALLYLALFRRLQRPIVYTAHVVTPHESIPLEWPIYRGIYGLADHLVAHSEFDRRRLIEEFDVEAARVSVIPHGEYGFFKRHGELLAKPVARKELGIETDAEVALFFGYVREYKGLDVLLDAWPTVVAARPRARLVIAGDPVRLAPERLAELKAQAHSVGAMHRFDYVPFAEVTRYFGAANTLVMPYRQISQSGVLFAGLALGVPIVATRVGGLPETLRDGESALLVPPESPADLAKALIRILGDTDLRIRLRDGGRRVADRRSWATIAERTESLLTRLIDASP